MRKNSNGGATSWDVLQGMAWDADGMLVPDRTSHTRNGRRSQASKVTRRASGK